MIFDAHVHLPCYGGLVILEDKRKQLLIDLNNSGIDGAIVIADSELVSPVGNTKECVELFREDKNIFVIGGISPLIEYETQLNIIENYLKQKEIIAIKLYPGHEAYFMDDVRLIRTFDLCEKYNVPIAIHTGWDNSQYNHPRYFADIAKNHPKMKIVMCHMWYPDLSTCYEVTSKYSNIYWDISSLAYKREQLDKITCTLSHIAQLRAERIIMGSDYGACSIFSHIDLVNNLNISDERKLNILYKNAFKLYGITLSNI